LSFFDCIMDMPRYQGKLGSLKRLNLRHRFLVEDFADEIKGTRLLDLGAHDGRWSYAYAAAGAAEVVGFEGRKEVAEQFSEWPNSDFRSKVDMRVTDLFDGLDASVSSGERFDVVAILGIFYHVMDHFRILKQARTLGAKLIIIDSEFSTLQGNVIAVATERTDLTSNAIEGFEGNSETVVGYPTPRALEAMAKALGYDVFWSNWDALPEEQRQGVRADYFRKNKWKRRATCALRAKPS